MAPAGADVDPRRRDVEFRGTSQGAVVGDDAEVTNIFHVYGAAPRSLGTHIRDAEALVTERTREFVGRDFIFKAIDDAIGSPDFASGYVVVAGEPGVGKTALAAELVRRRGWVHHFNIATQNVRSVREFLANVFAQLIVRHRLDHSGLQPEALTDSGFLVRLLAEAARAAGDDPVVVMIDALDEADDAGLPPEANVLYLPQTLPAGAYLVVTTRPRHDYRLFVDSSRDIFLDDASPQNLADVERYIRSFIAAHADPMKARIAAWRAREHDFVKAMIEGSEGNFMYLHHVIRDIRDGRVSATTVDSIADLPRGLRAYYRRHWRTMQEADPEQFESDYSPVVCMLAAAQEPVGAAQVAEWTGIEPQRVAKVIQEWREFLNVEPHDGESLYRIYHASFRDFLKEEVGLTASHSRISEAAFAKIRWPRRAR